MEEPHKKNNNLSYNLSDINMEKSDIDINADKSNEKKIR